MIYAALLLIIAILLFGSSAILGAIGAILGFIAAVAALAVAIYFSGPALAAIGVSGENAPWAIVLIVCGILAVGRVVIYLFDTRQ